MCFKGGKRTDRQEVVSRFLNALGGIIVVEDDSSAQGDRPICCGKGKGPSRAGTVGDPKGVHDVEGASSDLASGRVSASVQKGVIQRAKELEPA